MSMFVGFNFLFVLISSGKSFVVFSVHIFVRNDRGCWLGSIFTAAKNSANYIFDIEYRRQARTTTTTTR